MPPNSITRIPLKSRRRLEAIVDNLLPACSEGAADVAVRESMAYASLCSGIALANAGLGIVHGLASPMGGFFTIPHGVVCGTLMAAAVRANWQAMKAREPRNGAIAKEISRKELPHFLKKSRGEAALFFKK